MSAPSRWPATPEGEEAFAGFLARRDAGEALDLESYCSEHPAVAGELRELWQIWSGLAPELGDDPLEELLAEDEFQEPEHRYEIQDEIGRGGMGVVYRVWDNQLCRTLAMKVIRASAPGRAGLRRVSRFLEEARITGRLGHPGIVPIHELGVDADEQLYFTMPLVEGHTLEEILERQRAGDGDWTRARVLGVLLRACEAMAFAHDRGVVHRDLKPSNVMVGRFGETYVMDWGLARALEEADRAWSAAASDEAEHAEPAEQGRSGSSREGASSRDSGPDAALLTREGDVLGTPAFMPPEQAAGRRSELGPAADVYAMGATLYQLLTLRRPYDDGTPLGADDVLARVKSGPPRAITSHGQASPPELCAICDKAMAREASERYADMGAMAADLRAFLEGRVVRAYEEGGWAEFKKWVGRNRVLAGAACALLVVVLVGLGAIAWVQSRGKAAVLRLSDFQLLSEYEAEVEDLWPAHPERVADMESWLQRARELTSRLPQHEARLAWLDERAASHPGGAEAFFDDPEERWQGEKLAELVNGLRAFAGDGEHGPVAQVEARLETARSIRRRSVDDHLGAWQACAERVADPNGPYGGLTLKPQLGLVPLGPDPRSELEEFAHLTTGEMPVRAADGRLSIGVDSGLVLVLLPGGRFTMGADRTQDEWVTELESPPHEVRLAPFFLSKYEMTQAQWARFTGSDPSNNAGATPASPLRPVENMTWLEAQRRLGHLALELPTESQWEYAARAGTQSAWWVGADSERLEGAESIDGYGTLPIGSASPNPFGLYDVLGNTMEWCRDRYGEYRATTPVGPEGVREVAPPAARVVRGGHCAAPPHEARASLRRYKAEGDAHVFLGVRPARALAQHPNGERDPSQGEVRSPAGE